MSQLPSLGEDSFSESGDESKAREEQKDKLIAAAQEKAARLAQETQEAKGQAEQARAASLRAQVPSVGYLPCSAENLLEGMLAKLAPHLVGAPEQAGLAEEVEQLITYPIEAVSTSNHSPGILRCRKSIDVE